MLNSPNVQNMQNIADSMTLITLFIYFGKMCSYQRNPAPVVELYMQVYSTTHDKIYSTAMFTWFMVSM